jgi:transposase InsO family protein
MFDLDHDPLVRLIHAVQRLGHDAIQPGALELVEPAQRHLAVGGRRRHVYRRPAPPSADTSRSRRAQRRSPEPVNHKRVARLMRRIGLQGLRLRRRHRTTIPDPAAATAGDLIGRDFTAAAPNQRYVGDITYLPVGERGFLYVATVLDLHSRRLAGYAIVDHVRAELVIDALAAAQCTRGSLAGAIFHAHGAQYTSRAFAAACTGAGIRQSMGPVGGSADNAAAESFNATFKRETLQGRRAFTDERDARLTAVRWLHRYHTTRRHSRLGQRSPTAYEHTTTTSTTLPHAA